MEARKRLIEERSLPEQRGVLGSKTTSICMDGSILKESKVPFCDFCGIVLKEEKLAICCQCQEKICSACLIDHESRIFCRQCAKDIVNITKDQFMLLHGIANQLTIKQVKDLSHIGSDSLKILLLMMLERGLIERKGLSFFTSYAITERGMSLLQTSEQIYSREGDALRYIINVLELKIDERTY